MVRGRVQPIKHGQSAGGADVLRHLFVVLTGLGMRESSGKYCQGRDTSANNTGADTAEAALFQVSHNSIGAHSCCRRSLISRRARPTSAISSKQKSPAAPIRKNWGAREGNDFQNLIKDCPAFAVEYAALPKIRRHWGPINNKTAELRTECDDLFKSVWAFIDSNGITEV